MIYIMDERFLTLEGGRDSTEYWLQTDKEVDLYEDILPLFGFANPSKFLVLFKELFLFFLL